MAIILIVIKSAEKVDDVSAKNCHLKSRLILIIKYIFLNHNPFFEMLQTSDQIYYRRIDSNSS